MNHTPGPWRAYRKQDTQGQGLPQWRIHGPGVTGSIATVDFDLTQPTVRKQNENVSSNAHLIAAAPELLEALKEAVRIASDEHGEIFKGDLQARESAIIAWKHRACTAITKAEGKEPQS